VDGFCEHGNEHDLIRGGVLVGPFSHYQLLDAITSSYHSSNCTLVWRLCGSHSGAAEDSGLLGCDAVSSGEWSATFRRNQLP
jgi:hypothetical protein